MTDYLRMRQLCLASFELEPCVKAIEGIFGLQSCHSDHRLAKWGLHNALFVFGNTFLEIVAPIRDDTAVHRFLARSGGRGGYIVIFDCNDVQRRRAHAEALGMRVVLAASFPDYHNIQLHPRDCRATMLEFDHSVGGEDPAGFYWPAGNGNWQAFRQVDKAWDIPEIEVSSPTPDDLAGHWSRLTEVPLDRDDHDLPVLRFGHGRARFVQSADGRQEAFSAMTVLVADADGCLDRARSLGLPVAGGGFEMAGVRFDLAKQSA